MRRLRWLWPTLPAWLLLFAVSTGQAAEQSAEALLAKIKAVGKEGQGSSEAARAWKELVKLGPGALTQILAAMDDNQLATTNWLRPAVDAIAEKAVQGRQPLPVEQLEQFVKQAANPPAGRRLAYEWLCQVDKKTPERFLPGMLLDPSSDLRRDAVAVVIKEAQALLEKGDKPAASAAFRKALTGACDQDQVDALAKALKALDVTVDLAAHFGFVRHWHLVSPFDNSNMAGFKVLYPPEKGVDLKEVYKGKNGAEARWLGYTTTDPYGKVDLNKILGKHKGAIAYAQAVVDSPVERPIQIRIGSFNAVKIFLNGKEVLAHNEYHHGMRVDQYTGSATLKAGRNELLLKICQNEQTEDWAQSWIFQVRLCETVGAAVPFTQTPVKSEAPKEEKGKDQ